MDPRANGDDAAVLALARTTHAQHAARSDLRRRIDEAPAALQALRAADDAAEVFLLGVPFMSSPAVVAAAVQDLLRPRCARVAGGEEQGGAASRAPGEPEMRDASPVLRCELRAGKRYGARGTGFVLLRSRALAEYALLCSPVRVRGFDVPIKPSTRALGRHGASWQTRLEPGALRFPVGLLQVGELRESMFATFWASSPFFDLSQEAHVEVNPVSRVLAVTLGRAQVVQAGDEATGTFSPRSAMLRVEFPLHSVCSAAVPHHERPNDPRRAVYLRIVHPPALFRGEVGAAGAAHSDTLWDSDRGSLTEMRWTRTVDPTAHFAFSRASGVRIFLDAGEPFFQFYSALQRFCLSEPGKPVPEVVPSKKDTQMHEEQGMFELYAYEGLSFSVRYEVACLIHRGGLLVSDLADVDNVESCDFWEALKTLQEGDALRVLDAMHMLAEGEDGYTLLRPYDALSKCMEMLHVDHEAVGAAYDEQIGNARTTPVGRFDFEDAWSDADSDHMDEEEALLEVFRRQLNLGTEEEDKAENVLSSKTRNATAPSHRGNTSSTSAPSNGTNSREGAEDRGEAPTPTKRTKAEAHHAYIRRLVLTPTRVVACRAESDLLNRVLREFQVHKHRFLRVSFTDEDGGSIAYVGSTDIYARVRQLLRDGVWVAGELFVFLAFSSSQLRDHGCWLYNETPSKDNQSAPIPPTVEAIRGESCVALPSDEYIRLDSKVAEIMFSSNVPAFCFCYWLQHGWGTSRLFGCPASTQPVWGKLSRVLSERLSWMMLTSRWWMTSRPRTACVVYFFFKSCV